MDGIFLSYLVLNTLKRKTKETVQSDFKTLGETQAAKKMQIPLDGDGDNDSFAYLFASTLHAQNLYINHLI